MPSLLGNGGNKQDETKAISGPVIRSGGKIYTGKKQPVHFYFVFDTTGSMSDKIEALLNTIINFVEEPHRNGLEAFFTLVSFGDLDVCPNDRIIVEIHNTSDVALMQDKLRHINHNGGGGNNGESCLEAINEAIKHQSAPGAVKVLVLLTDEPALQSHHSPTSITHELGQKEFLVYCITPDYEYFRLMATSNGGQWQRISADSKLDMSALFKKLAQQVSELAKNVHQLAHGSVSAYLQLQSGKKK